MEGHVSLWPPGGSEDGVRTSLHNVVGQVLGLLQQLAPLLRLMVDQADKLLLVRLKLAKLLVEQQ
jgi:hypothetical protein